MNKIHEYSPSQPEGSHHDHRSIELLSDILASHDQRAAQNRALLNQNRVFTLNLMSSPGSGKTTLLEATAQKLGPNRMAAIVGDLETENDADRLRSSGVETFGVQTATLCHLEAPMVADGVSSLDLYPVDYLFIENVGNLVCPAGYDLGQHANVVLLSTTEGDDKPWKYPWMFMSADIVIITKSDLLPFLDDFEIDKVRDGVAALGSEAPVIALSAIHKEGFPDWVEWLETERRRWSNP